MNISISSPFRPEAARRSVNQTAVTAALIVLTSALSGCSDSPTQPHAAPGTIYAYSVEVLQPGPAVTPPAGYRHAATLTLAVRNTTAPSLLSDISVGFSQGPGSALTGDFRVVEVSPSRYLPVSSLTSFRVVVASNEDVCVSSAFGVKLTFSDVFEGFEPNVLPPREIGCADWPALLGK